MDRKTDLLKKLQAELDRRTQIENEAVRLMENCEFEKAQELLGSLDESIVREIERELDRLDTDAEIEKSIFCKMIDRMCQLHPECENYHETRVELCREFLETTKGMQGTDLEPYLAEMKCTPYDGCFNISFKIPLVPYSELKDLQ